MLPRAARRVNWTIKIEMHVPRARLAFLKQKVQHRRGPLLFVKTAAGVFVVREPPREVIATRQGRFNHRPRFKLYSNPAFTIHIGYSFDEMPELLGLHSLQEEQQCLLLVERP